MLTIKQLNQYYGESHTLWDLDVELKAGECTCLMGRNGVGKTTLLKAIMGLLPLRSGSLQFKTHELSKESIEARAKIGIGYVPQGREIFSQLTVEENLKIGAAALGRLKLGIPPFIFELFPVLKEMLQRKGGDLSGGQQQQLAIGRALMIDPSLLILDEPTEGIQPNTVSQIGDVINQLVNKHGMTVLVVEQKLGFARKVGQNFIMLEKGRKVAEGKMAQLSDELVRTYLSV